MSNSDPYNYQGYPSGFESVWKFPLPSEKERDLRWNTIRKCMRKSKLDCLIVGGAFGHVTFPNNNVYYIANFVPFLNPGTYVVFPLEGEPRLCVSSSIGPQYVYCAAETSWIKETVQSLNPAVDIIDKIKKMKLEKGNLGIIGYNRGVFPAVVNDALRAAFPGAGFVDASAAYNEAMNEVSRASEEELVFLKKTAEIHDISYKAVLDIFRPGVDERELWAAAEKAIIENGGWLPHFLMVAAGPSPIFPRAPAGHYKLKKGDLIMFENNVVYGGILSQICFTLALGTPEKNTARMYDFVGELYEFSISEHEKKKNCGNIEQSLMERIHAAGYEPMTPQIHIYNQSVDMPAETPAQPGDYFIVHPNVCTRDFRGGAKFGDTVRVGQDGKLERLQKTPARLHIINP